MHKQFDLLTFYLNYFFFPIQILDCTSDLIIMLCVINILCWYCSVADLCLTLWDPMDYSIPGSSVLHYLLEFTQTVEPFYLQDAERENRKESHLDVPWEVSPSWFLFLYRPWRLCVEWLDCDSQATTDAQKPIKEAGRTLWRATS